MSRGYLTEGQTVEERVGEISTSFHTHLLKMGMEPEKAFGYEAKFYDYMGQGYYSLATPVWTNFGNDRGLPVSCFGSVLGDNMESITFTQAETSMLMKYGGGTSGYFGELRPRGASIKNNGESSGSVHFMQMFDSTANIVSQGNTRRGFFTPYLDIEHPDAEEFLTIGDEGHPIQDMTTGINLSADFLDKAREGDSKSRQLLAKVHKSRADKGYPYIIFKDNANNYKPDVYKEKDMDIKASNMCSEIMLPSSEEETFVCVLSSINLAKWDEIKETDAVEVLTIFLDCVVQEFIEKLEYLKETQKHFFLDRVLNFAKNHRALGLGVLGWHHYLQSKMIPFESTEAAKLNNILFKEIRSRTEQASTTLADWFGPCPLHQGEYSENKRNTTLMAIAPTKSSSFILGQVSQSIEPEFANIYIKDLSKIKVTVKNPFLTQVLDKYGENNEKTWDSIANHAGSVQHLEFLSDNELAVFKTFHEINPESIIDQAGVRQSYIDQGQSLNLIISPDMPIKEVNSLLYRANSVGLKSLYYQYSMNAAQMLTRERAIQSGCSSCEG